MTCYLPFMHNSQAAPLKLLGTTAPACCSLVGSYGSIIPTVDCAALHGNRAPNGRPGAVQGIIFVILSVTGVRQFLIKLLPRTLSLSMSIGEALHMLHTAPSMRLGSCP